MHLSNHIKAELTELLKQKNQNVSGYITIYNDVVKDVSFTSDKSQNFQEINIDPLSSFAELVFNPDNKTGNPDNVEKVKSTTPQPSNFYTKFSTNIPITKFSKLDDSEISAFYYWYLGLSDQNAANIKGIAKKSYQKQRKQAFKKLGISNKIIIPPPQFDKRKPAEWVVFITIPDKFRKKRAKPHNLAKTSTRTNLKQFIE